MDPSPIHLRRGEGGLVSPWTVDSEVNALSAQEEMQGDHLEMSSLAYHYNFNHIIAYSSFSCMKSRFLWIEIIFFCMQAVETALALWVAMQNPVSQMYDNSGLAEFWGPDE